MLKDDRARERERLDKELHYLRIAGKTSSYFPRWLRRVRQALGVHVTEMAKELEVNASVIFRLELSEDRKSISLRAMEKMAGALECKLVYGIVPRDGSTLMELAERKNWRKLLRKV